MPIEKHIRRLLNRIDMDNGDEAKDGMEEMDEEIRDESRENELATELAGMDSEIDSDYEVVDDL